MNVRGIKNMGAAKHRYESWAKPLGRFTIFLLAIITTADWMMVTRRGKSEGKDAESFLREVDEVQCLSIALMADSSDEGLAIQQLKTYLKHHLAERSSYLYKQLRQVAIEWIIVQVYC